MGYSEDGGFSGAWNEKQITNGRKGKKAG